MMKQIFVNLKRFDISPARGGVNRLAPMAGWGAHIVHETQEALAGYDPQAVAFTFFFPEAHLLAAGAARVPGSPIRLGCQGVYRADTAAHGAFGAFTTNRTANAAHELGCQWALVGHCEERVDKAGILAEAGVQDTAAVERILHEEVLAAQAAGLHVLYCIGETAAQQPQWQQVLAQQLEVGLSGADRHRVAIAYEPVWSIGPGKTPADQAYITKVARFVKTHTGGLPVVYGGGLKQDNAAMLARIPEIDGGLIALTRFSGEIGFYPDEFLQIAALYLSGANAPMPASEEENTREA